MGTLVAVELPAIQAIMLAAQRKMRQAYEDVSGLRRCLSESPSDLHERWGDAGRSKAVPPLDARAVGHRPGRRRYRCRDFIRVLYLTL